MDPLTHEELDAIVKEAEIQSRLTGYVAASLFDRVADAARASIPRPIADAPREWQPFDTAPTNGIVILVYREDAGVFTASYRSTFTCDDEAWFDSNGDDLQGDLPSHWMYFPKPPTESAAISGEGGV